MSHDDDDSDVAWFVALRSSKELAILQDHAPTEGYAPKYKEQPTPTRPLYGMLRRLTIHNKKSQSINHHR